ncbi:MAG: two-component regulator propeller domain-containing protein [Spirochaetales bacterium]
MLFISTVAAAAIDERIPDPDTAVFDRLNATDGLINASVSSILQDAYGFVWLATQGGLQRYDGTDMRLYTNEPFADNQLSHHLIQTLFYEGPDILWVGTYGGLNRLDSGTGRFDSFVSDEDDRSTLDSNVIVSIGRDSRGVLWVGTLEGLNRMDDESTGVVTRFSDEIDGSVRSLFLDSRDRFWIGTDEGLYRMQYRDDTPQFEQVGKDLPAETVMDIVEDADGDIWVGTWDGGVSKLDPNGALVEHYTLHDTRIYTLLVTSSGVVYTGTWGGGLAAIDPDTGETTAYRADEDDRFSLAHDVVYSLHEDALGRIWVGTNGNGISILDPARRDYRLVHSQLPPEQRLPQGQVQSLFYDEQDEILYAGMQQSGFAARDQSDGTFTHWSHDSDDPNSPSSDQINAIMRDGNTLLLGSNKGIDRFDPASGEFKQVWQELSGESDLSPPIVYALSRSSRGTLWIGTYDNGVLRRTPDGEVHHYPHVTGDRDSLSDNLVYDIYEDAAGDVWVGTNRGLNRYDREIDGFQQYRYDPTNPRGISHDSIIHAFEDSADNLWFATRGGGLMRYKRDSDTWTHVTTDDGLSTNHIRSAGAGARGVVYAAHAFGVDRIELDTMTITTLGDRDGLFGEEITGARTRLPDGSLLFGGFSVITRIDDDPRARRAPVSAPIQITGITVMNRAYDSGVQPHLVEHMELSHEENTVGFQFTSLDFVSADSDCYEYRLLGFDDTWSECSMSGDVGFINLPPGEYTFEVREATASPDQGSEVARLALTIVPPFWRTRAFAVLAAVLVLFLVWFGIHLRTRILTARAESLQKQVDERTRELSLANEALRVNNATKDRFFSLVSHDLRSPISGISQLTRRVHEHFDTYDREALHEVTAAILETAEGLESMLSNLLEWARLQRKKVVLEPTAVPADELIQAVVAAYTGAALAKNVRIETQCSADVAVLADVYRLRTVIENLVSNAIKFTPQGGGITLGCECPASDPSKVRLFVSDTGVGIPPERLENLLSGETLTRTVGTAGERGSGLGLTVSREIISRLGGTIAIDSTPGKGTTVSVMLPVPEQSSN